jgi:Domain of unknown function (DUF4412)
MRARIATAVAALAIPCLSHADFEGVLVSKMTGEHMNGTTRMWVSKAGMRAETQLAVPEAQQAQMGKTVRSVMLVKTAEPNRTYVLDENRKTYWVHEYKPGEAQGGNDEGYKARRVGKDTVAGFSCDKVVLTDSGGRESDVCVAPDIVSGDSWVRAFQQREQKAGNHGMWKALLDAGVKGLPIRWSHRPDKEGHGGFQMELVSAQKQSVPSSTFAIPADYKQSEMVTPFSSPESAKRMEEALKKMTPEQRKQMEEMMKKMGGGKN